MEYLLMWWKLSQYVNEMEPLTWFEWKFSTDTFNVLKFITVSCKNEPM